jgi:hypothetical protein
MYLVFVLGVDCYNINYLSAPTQLIYGVFYKMVNMIKIYGIC